MFIFHILRNLYIQYRYRSEIQELKEIINDYKYEGNDELVIEANKVYYDRRDKNKWAFAMQFWKNHPDVQILRDFPEITGNILDFGSGSGNLDILSWLKITGIDLSPLWVMLANKNKEMYKNENVSFFSWNIITDTYNIPYKCDSVWSTQTFEHIPDPSQIFDALRKYAKPNAPMLITVPYQHAYEDEGHVHHFMTAKELDTHLSKYVDVKKVVLYPKFRILAALVHL